MSRMTSKPVVVLLLCAGMVIPSVGCQSMGFDKFKFKAPTLPSLPKLPSLAFGKKDNDELPPPPARHFDPSRFDAEADIESQIVENDRSGRDRKSEYGLSKPSFGSDARSDFADRKPIRKPYGMSDFSSERKAESNSFASSGGSFDLDSSQLKSKFEESASSATSQLSSAQQQFKNAMNSKLGGSSFSGGNDFSSSDNSFAGSQSGSNDFAGFGSNDRASSNSFAASSNSFSSGLSSKIDNADSQIRSAASDLKSSFDQRLAAAHRALDKKQGQLNEFASAADKTRQLASQAFGGGNADTGASAANAKIEEAKRKLEQLNQRMAAAKLAAEKKAAQAKSSIDQYASQFDSRVASSADTMRNTVDNVVAPIESRFNQFAGQGEAQMASHSNSFDSGGSDAGNVARLRVNSPLQPQPATSSNSFYPSTPHGGFSSNQSLRPISTPSKMQINQFAANKGLGGDGQGGQVEQVGFSGPMDQINSNGLSQSGGNFSPSTGYSRTARIDDVVPDVSIPSAILTGSSSFSPGSTTPLRR